MGYKEEKQRQLDIRYLRMARIWAENSYCARRQVGALIVRDKMIISDGYNGTPAGFENICEDAEGRTKPYVLHAEANAITKLAKSANSGAGATLYITTMPCIECSKLIIQAGIVRVVYCDSYHSHDGLELLQRVGIELVRVADEDLAAQANAHARHRLAGATGTSCPMNDISPPNTALHSTTMV